MTELRRLARKRECVLSYRSLTRASTHPFLTFKLNARQKENKVELECDAVHPNNVGYLTMARNALDRHVNRRKTSRLACYKKQKRP